MKQVDVVVVGAGLAGLQLSRVLAERGRSVLLIDRKRRLERAIHTTGIFVRRTFQDFLLPEDCLGPPVRHVTLYSPRRQQFSLASDQDEFRIANMGRLYERMLHTAKASGVQWRCDTEFVTAHPDGNGSRVELRQGSTTSELRARYLVGSDGVLSRVASSLGLSRNREWIVGVEDVYHGSAAIDKPSLHCYLDPKLAPGYIAWVAADGHETHVGVGGYSKWFEPKRALAEFTASVAGEFGLSQEALAESRGGRIPVGGILPEIVNEFGLLVGDASGAVSPLTAGGLDPCLRQSALAADVIDQYLASGDKQSLEPYRSTRLRRRFLVRRLLRKILSSIRTPWAAEATIATLRVPVLSPIARRIFFGRGSFPLPTADGGPLKVGELSVES